MAITTSAVGPIKNLDSGVPPYELSADIACTATDSGNLTVTHNAGRVVDEVSFTQLTGTAPQVINYTSATTTAVVITLQTVPTGGATVRMYMRFFANDAPAVT